MTKNMIYKHRLEYSCLMIGNRVHTSLLAEQNAPFSPMWVQNSVFNTKYMIKRKPRNQSKKDLGKGI